MAPEAPGMAEELSTLATPMECRNRGWGGSGGEWGWGWGLEVEAAKEALARPRGRFKV